MDAAFASAAASLRNDHRELDRKQRRRRVEEEKEKEAARRARQKSSLRRQEENQALALQREHRLNEQQNLRERNRGVFFESIPSNFAETDKTDSAGNGRGYVITSEACEKLHEECVMKSIRRAADKCIVDESMRRELLDVQGAMKNGPVCLELRSKTCNKKKQTNIRRTHVMVYAYSANHRTIGAGEKAIRCLEMEHLCVSGRNNNINDHSDIEQIDDSVAVRYVLLPKGKSAVLQPQSSDFHNDSISGNNDNGFDPREVLEQHIKNCCTLTEGDVLAIPRQRKEGEDLVESADDKNSSNDFYYINVVSVIPIEQNKDDSIDYSSIGAIDIVETDLEVDVLPSVEYVEEYQHRKQRIQGLAAKLLQTMEWQQGVLDSILGDDNSNKNRIDEYFKMWEEKINEEASLSSRSFEEHPNASDDNSCQGPCAILLPDGSRHRRKFRSSDSLSKVFEWIDSLGYLQHKWNADRKNAAIQLGEECTIQQKCLQQKIDLKSLASGVSVALFSPERREEQLAVIVQLENLEKDLVVQDDQLALLSNQLSQYKTAYHNSNGEEDYRLVISHPRRVITRSETLSHTNQSRTVGESDIFNVQMLMEIVYLT